MAGSVRETPAGAGAAKATAATTAVSAAVPAGMAAVAEAVQPDRTYISTVTLILSSADLEEQFWSSVK